MSLSLFFPFVCTFIVTLFCIHRLVCSDHHQFCLYCLQTLDQMCIFMQCSLYSKPSNDGWPFSFSSQNNNCTRFEIAISIMSLSVLTKSRTESSKSGHFTSYSRDSPRNLWNPRGHYVAHSSPSIVPFLSQIKLLYALSTNFLKSNSILFPPPHPSF